MEEGISFSNFEICIGNKASGTRFIEPLGELQKSSRNHKHNI
jgi:hypothetical protein